MSEAANISATFSFPELFPAKFPRPRFEIGANVQWARVPDPDYGLVLGVFYTREASCQIAGLHYLILLDRNSPSSAICQHDFAFEDDLEPVSSEDKHD